MDLGVVSLILLVIVVILGFLRKTNVGILAIAAASALAYVTGAFTTKEVRAGFSSSLFMTLCGVTLLFGIVISNKCLEVLMKKAVKLLGKQVWVIPILMYVVGWVVSAIGPGCVPTLAVVGVLAIPLAHETGYNPIMLMIIGDLGTYSGRWSPISPEGILVAELMGEQGYTGLLTPMMFNTFIGTVIFAIVAFIFYKGYKVKGAANASAEVQVENLDRNQIITLIGVAVMIAIVIIRKTDVGLTSFIIAAILMLVGVAKPKEALKSISWNTIIMVCGVGVLMNLVISTGGIDLLASIMSSVMSSRTAAPIAGLVAGCMSWFSSTSGVVLPTLLPTIGTIVEKVGAGTSAIAIISTIGVVSSSAGFSPASTVGALILGTVEGDPEYSKQYPTDKLFIELFAWSAFYVVFGAFISLLGLMSIMH